MIKRIPLKGAWEYDGLTGARKNYNFAPGARKYLKNKYNRRIRYLYRKCINAGDYSRL